MTQRPSGWYDDPHDDSQLRYFDGILWSDRTMPKLRPGLEHVGEARPASELPQHDEPSRRDGDPRSYPAHWGPEGVDRSQHPFAPRPGQPHGAQPFGSRLGKTAGLGSRFVAAIIDRIIISFVVAVGILAVNADGVDQMRTYMRDLLDAAQSGGQTPTMPGPLSTLLLVVTIVSALLAVFYDALMTRFCRGRTLGRMALGIQVVPARGGARGQGGNHRAEGAENPVPLGRAVLRALITWGPEVIGGFGLAVQIVVFFWALSNEPRQGLHDLAARTRVIHVR